MKRGKRVEWTRLDNAAKIFPPTSNDKDTKVFRFVCELQDEVSPDILQLALDETIDNFPIYKSVLRKGVFWYYLETSNIHPVVELESSPICDRIYFAGQRNLLFRVLYYKNRINVEIFHALSDGAGALCFVKTLVYYYLIKKYSKELGDNIPKLDYDSSLSQKMDDSFLKHYTKRKLPKREKHPRAYHIHETRREENRYKLVEGTMSVKDVLEAAHEYNTTMTVYLTALFMYSICKGMPARGKSRPVILSVPVNLRNYFESESARNFFGTINVGFNFGKDKIDFNEVIENVSDSFKRELEEERLLVHLNRLASLERNGLIRIVPLPVKDAALKIANQVAERGITSSISNVGKITMAEELKPFIKQFSVFTSARRPQIAICSFEDNLVVSFTSPYNETDIQKTFFQTLSHKGIDVKIVTNL